MSWRLSVRNSTTHCQKRWACPFVPPSPLPSRKIHFSRYLWEMPKLFEWRYQVKNCSERPSSESKQLTREAGESFCFVLSTDHKCFVLSTDHKMAGFSGP